MLRLLFICFFISLFPSKIHANTKQRIVSLAPSISETLIALGQEKSIVGHTSYCPKKTPGKNLGRLPVSLEAIIRCRPNLILSTNSSLASKPLINSGLKNVHYLPWSTISELKSSWLRIGHLVNAPEKAAALCQKLSATLLGMQPKEKRRKEKILLVISPLSSGDNNNLWLAGGQSFFNSVVIAMGHENVLGNNSTAWSQMSFEKMLKIQPDKIVVISANLTSKEAQERELQAWKKFSLLKAVKNKKLFLLGGENVVRSGPSLVDVLTRLHETLK